MMIVNLANAIRLLGQKDRAAAILAAEDWSATDDTFNVCAAAIREDYTNVATLIRKLGQNGGISAGEYRIWPVFRGLRENPEIVKAFRDVFSEELVTSTTEPPPPSKLN